MTPKDLARKKNSYWYALNIFKNLKNIYVGFRKFLKRAPGYIWQRMQLKALQSYSPHAAAKLTIFLLEAIAQSRVEFGEQKRA